MSSFSRVASFTAVCYGSFSCSFHMTGCSQGSSQHNRVEARGAKCCASAQERGTLSCWELHFPGWVFMHGELCVNSQAQAELAPVFSGVNTDLSPITQCFTGWRIEVLLSCATCPMQMRNYWGSQVNLDTGLPKHLLLRKPTCTASSSACSPHFCALSVPSDT